MPSAFLTSKAQDVVSDFCARSEISDTHKAEVAFTLLKMGPVRRRYLNDALDSLEREEIQSRQWADNDRLKELDRSAAIGATSEGQEVEL